MTVMIRDVKVLWPIGEIVAVGELTLSVWEEVRIDVRKLAE